jgi:hypothetical protein
MVQGLDYTGWTRPEQVTSACSTASILTPQPTVATGDLIPAGKQPGRKSGHWPASDVNDKNKQSCVSAPACTFTAWCLVKRTNNLDFTYDNPEIFGPEQCFLPTNHMCNALVTV